MMQSYEETVYTKKTEPCMCPTCAPWMHKPNCICPRCYPKKRIRANSFLWLMMLVTFSSYLFSFLVLVPLCHKLFPSWYRHQTTTQPVER